jgi:hypothetical protein
MVATPLLPVLLAIPLACAFLLTPAWRAWLGITPPAFGFVPNGAALVGYGTAFGLGWLLCRQPFLLERLARWWRVQAAVALLATLCCVAQIGRFPSMEFTPHTARLAVYAGVYALGVWAWTLALTGIAVRFLADERPVIRYLADSSYWIYIIHIPVLAALQPLVYPLGWPPLAKYALLLVGLAVLLPLSYELLVRHSFVGQWLNGRRYPVRGGGAARFVARWKAGASGLATVGLALLILVPRPGPRIGGENGRFSNDCCGTVELRDGGMLLNDKQAISYQVGRDARGPYILPRAYVGGFEQIGFEIDGTRQPAKLRLDRLPNPTRILLYDGSKPSIFERKAPVGDGG